MNANIEELLAKIKALADNGIEGEKQSAQMLFLKLCKKYKISPNEFENDTKINDYPITIKKDIELTLIIQISAMINPEIEIFRVKKGAYKIFNAKNFIRCKLQEFIEISEKKNHYLKAWEKAYNNFQYAFLAANDLLPRNPSQDKINYSEEEKEDINESIKLAAQLRKSHFFKSLNEAN